MYFSLIYKSVSSSNYTLDMKNLKIDLDRSIGEVDMLGTSDEPILWIAVPNKEIGEWFHSVAGTPTKEEAYYESHAINYVAAHPELIIKQRPEQTWIELELGKEAGDKRPRVDVLFVTEKELWIIEVKALAKDSDLKPVNDRLRGYSQRITELGWWPRRRHRLRAFWAYASSDAKKYRLEPWMVIPAEKLDFTGRRRLE